MSEQQSQKTGVRSDAQKQERARDGYDPMAPASQVAGAHGDHKRATPTDRDTAMDHLAGNRDEKPVRDEDD